MRWSRPPATVVGPVKWGGQGPFKNVSKTPLVLGQWGKGQKYKYELTIVNNQAAPNIPVGGKALKADAGSERHGALLALHAVSKSYGALKVTDAITLAVRAGETLGILGPNGAGKTTLFNLISGDVRCDAGSVRVRRPRRDQLSRTSAAAPASAAATRCRSRSAT